MACFEPLGLADSVHNGLPFLSDLGNAYRLQPNATLAGAIHEGFGETIDYFLVRWADLIYYNLALYKEYIRPQMTS